MNITFTFKECMRLILVWKIFTLVTTVLASLPGILMGIKDEKQLRKDIRDEKRIREGIRDEKRIQEKKVIGFQTTTIDKDSRT